MHILVRAFGLLFVAVYISFLFDFQAKEKISSLETVSWSVVHCSLLLRVSRFHGEPNRGGSFVFKDLQNEATSSNMAASMVGAVQSL